MGNNILLISGGSFFGKSMAAAIHRLIVEYDQKYNVLCGSSIGSVLAYVLAAKGADSMYYHAINTDFASSHRIFGLKYKPFNKKGGFSIGSLLSLLFYGAPVNQHVAPILRKIVSKSDHDSLINSTTKCFVLVGDINGKRKKYYCLNSFDYESALQIIEASCRMQSMCNPIDLEEGVLAWDGGQFDHCPGLELINKDTNSVTCVWSRPEGWQLESEDLLNKGWLARHAAMIDINFVEKSLNDEARINQACEDISILPRHIFMNRVLKNFYDDDRQRQEQQIKEAINATDKAFQK